LLAPGGSSQAIGDHHILHHLVAVAAVPLGIWSISAAMEDACMHLTS
jgi:hypothetical protein